MVVPYRIRMMLPPEVRVLVSRVRPSARAERRTIERNLVFPDTLRPTPRRPGSVWGVAMMRNEADTAGPVIEHMFAQGVDQVLVADNRSSDETPEILARLADRFPVHIVQDNLEAHLQGAKMSVLVARARAAGADWIVPFDADELWFAKGRTVASFLRTCEADIVHATVHDVFPSPDDDPDEPNPFLRLHCLDTAPFPVGKVAFRTAGLLKVAEGNLDVSRRGRRTDGLMIAHYPWRTYEQMVGKVRHGRRAMEQTGLAEEMGIHWRVAGAWSDDELRAAWNDLLAGLPVDDLSWSPIGPLETGRPGTWASWRHQSDTASQR